jgi:hypothetical protein
MLIFSIFCCKFPCCSLFSFNAECVEPFLGMLTLFFYSSAVISWATAPALSFWLNVFCSECSFSSSWTVIINCDILDCSSAIAHLQHNFLPPPGQMVGILYSPNHQNIILIFLLCQLHLLIPFNSEFMRPSDSLIALSAPLAESDSSIHPCPSGNMGCFRCCFPGRP